MVDFTLGTAVSSRIRLARNLNGYPFPARLKSDRQAKEIIRAVSAALNKVDEFKLYYMDGISEDEALNFVENRLISPALLNTPSRSAALINEKGDISVMVNEEDHLREQCISQGMSLRSAYKSLSAKDSLIARSIPFAYDEQLGYLTACPTNLGTGLRASVMLFLPALTINGVMPRLLRSISRLGLTARGMFGEGSAAEGYIYQISNEVTLGVTEEEILALVEDVVKRVCALEEVQRENLKSCPSALDIKDECLRSYGILTNCAKLSTGELVKLAAAVKLGACLGYINLDDVSLIDELVVKMRPSNINTAAERVIPPLERDVYRAQHVSKYLKKIISA